MILNFTHNNIDYLNYDTNDEDEIKYLVEQIGQDAFNEIIENYSEPKTEVEKLQEQMDLQNQAIAELTMLMAIGGM